MFDWIKLLWQTESKFANEKQIAKHLSKVLLFELSGTKALYKDVEDKAERLVAKMAEIKMPIKITETFRSAKRQNELSNSVTKAKGLSSYHQYGLAFDIMFLTWGYNPPSNWWLILGKEGEKLSLEWGGRWTTFPDRCHFQWTANGTINLKDIKTYFE